MKLDELVGKYIELRDRKAVFKAEYDQKVSKLDQALEKIEAILLKTFDDTGMESVRTDAGTAYKSVRTSTSVADRDIFLGFVRDNDAWELLETRAAKKAVEEYVAANEELPPGVNMRSEVTVNVRRTA